MCHLLDFSTSMLLFSSQPALLLLVLPLSLALPISQVLPVQLSKNLTQFKHICALRLFVGWGDGHFLTLPTAVTASVWQWWGSDLVPEIMAR